MKHLVAEYTPKVVGGLFLISGFYKLIFPAEATYALLSLDVPRVTAVFTVIGVTAVEFYLAVLLLAKLDTLRALMGASVLMFLFTMFLWYLATLAHPPACGCMGLTGMFRSTRHEALFGLVRNCLILWAVLISYNHHRSAPHQASPSKLAAEVFA